LYSIRKRGRTPRPPLAVTPLKKRGRTPHPSGTPLKKRGRLGVRKIGKKKPNRYFD
jgi:hypothetical protein